MLMLPVSRSSLDNKTLGDNVALRASVPQDLGAILGRDFDFRGSWHLWRFELILQSSCGVGRPPANIWAT